VVRLRKCKITSDVIVCQRTELDKVKKLSRYRHATTKRERKYSSYSFLTSALDVGEWSASLPDRSLAPVKDHRYPVWTQRLKEKSFASARDRTPVV
jgi:hypothetical protein